MTGDAAILETERLRLREMGSADLPALGAILQDDTTMTAYEGAFSDAETVAWLERMRERYRNDGFGLWGVELRSTGEMIGQCGLTWQRIDDAEVIEVGYLFNRAHWGRGYATEAAVGCVGYGFERLGAERIYAQVRDTNLASMNVATRLGMTVRGRFVKHYRGVDMPHLAFAIDQRDWAARAAASSTAT